MTIAETLGGSGPRVSARGVARALTMADSTSTLPDTMTNQTEPRPLSEIAREIRADWANVNFAAKPYLSAMASLGSVRDSFGYDSGKSIVLYFLSNARGWRGPVAKRVKAELRGMVR